MNGSALLKEIADVKMRPMAKVGAGAARPLEDYDYYIVCADSGAWLK